MTIDFMSAIIFGLFAILVFKNSFSVKFTTFLAILATIVPHIVAKLLAYLPYLIAEVHTAMPLSSSPNEIIVTLIQLPISIIVLLMIRKNDDSLYRFTLWVVIGMFINYMLLPFLVH